MFFAKKDLFQKNWPKKKYTTQIREINFLLKKVLRKNLFHKYVGIIILNFTNHPSIMHTYKNYINFLIIQQLFVFILTASCISL